MSTATKGRLTLDIAYNKARQEAILLIHELYEAGFISSFCKNEASYHLTNLFVKYGVEITTKEQRHVAKIMEEEQ